MRGLTAAEAEFLRGCLPETGIDPCTDCVPVGILSAVDGDERYPVLLKRGLVADHVERCPLCNGEGEWVTTTQLGRLALLAHAALSVMP